MAVHQLDSRMDHRFDVRPGVSPRAGTDWLQAIWAPRVLSIVRIVCGLIFMEHGTQKWLGFPPSGKPTPDLFSMSGFGGMLELVGGALLVFGLFTRPVAFLLSGEMAVAYWTSHAPRGLFPILNGGDAAILYCFIFLYLAFAGGGAWSLDRAIRRKP
jgi:putative oxidoreductase